MVADAALGRAAVDVVLDAEASEHLDLAAIHSDREMDRQLALGHAQNTTQVGAEVEQFGGDIELPLGVYKRGPMFTRHSCFLLSELHDRGDRWRTTLSVRLHIPIHMVMNAPGAFNVTRLRLSPHLRRPNAGLAAARHTTSAAGGADARVPAAHAAPYAPTERSAVSEARPSGAGRACSTRRPGGSAGAGGQPARSRS